MPCFLPGFTQGASQLLSPEDLKKRLAYMTAVVYPTISEKAKNSKDREGVKFIKNNLIIKEKFPSGAQVMVKDELRSCLAAHDLFQSSAAMVVVLILEAGIRVFSLEWLTMVNGKWCT